jgi:hypothetical protein
MAAAEAEGYVPLLLHIVAAAFGRIRLPSTARWAISPPSLQTVGWLAHAACSHRGFDLNNELSTSIDGMLQPVPY